MQYFASVKLKAVEKALKKQEKQCCSKPWRFDLCFNAAFLFPSSEQQEAASLLKQRNIYHLNAPHEHPTQSFFLSQAQTHLRFLVTAAAKIHRLCPVLSPLSSSLLWTRMAEVM